MLSFNFSSVASFKNYVNSVVKSAGIYSRTGQAKVSARLVLMSEKTQADFLEYYGVQVPKYFTMRLREVVNAIDYGLATGRFNLNAETLIRGLSGYQYAKMVVKLALTKANTAEIVGYFNGKNSIELPIV